MQYSYTPEDDAVDVVALTSFVIEDVLTFLYALGFLKCWVLVLGIN